MNVKYSGDAPERVKRLSIEFSGWITKATGDIAKNAIAYIKSNFLHGRAMNKITGELEGSIKQWRDKREGAWYFRPGVGISGSLNYLTRYIGTEHEFMVPGWEEYQLKNNITDYLADYVEKKF